MPSKSTPERTTPPKTTFKVLVVEDEGLIARDISTRLEGLGHEVIATAETAEEAIAQAGGADIVLMDIRLDGPLDGIQAAAKIRELYSVPVIFLTAHTDRATLERAKITGPFGYLVKPLAAASLQTAIEVAVYKHGMERRLEIQEAWLTAVLTSIGDAVVATDPQGLVRFMNPAAERLTQRSAAKSVDMPINEILPFTDSELNDACFEPVPLALVRGTTVAMGRNIELACSGSRMLVEGEASPVKANGETHGAVLSLRNVTARRWEEQKVRQAQKMDVAARLAASVASEFETLLAIVRSQCDQLLEQFSATRALRRPLEEILQAATAAEQINRRLAGFRADSSITQRETLSLNAVMRRLHRLIESLAGDRIPVEVHLDPAAGKILADSAQFEQMIMNVAIHCSEQIAEGGALRIETAPVQLADHGEYTKVSFRYVPADSYAGNPTEADTLEKMFEPSALDPHHTGMAIALSIVRSHDGFLEAQALTSGEIQIDALLPRHLEISAPVAPAGNEYQPAILLIEPRDIVRGQVHNFFEAHGYNLMEAASAEEALALVEIHEGSLDLIIAPETDAAQIVGTVRPQHPDALVLSVVERTSAEGPTKIRNPYTQTGLMAKASALLAQRNGQANTVAVS